MAVNEVLNALKPSQIDTSGQLHVVNGMSTTTSSSLITAARENLALDSGFTDGLLGRPSTPFMGGAVSDRIPRSKRMMTKTRAILD